MKIHMNLSLTNETIIACGAKGKNLQTTTADDYNCTRCEATLHKGTGRSQGWSIYGAA